MAIPKSAEEVQNLLFNTPPVEKNSQPTKLYGEENKETEKKFKSLKSIEAEVFKILDANGYSRNATIPVVANFIDNLNRTPK